MKTTPSTEPERPPAHTTRPLHRRIQKGAAQPGKWADAPRRLLTLFVGGPIVFALLIGGTPFFDVLVGAVALIAAWEYAQIVKPVSRFVRWSIPLYVLVGVIAATNLQPTIYAAVGGVGLALSVLDAVSRGGGVRLWARDLGLALLSGVYIGMLLGAVLLVRGQSTGLLWTALLLATNWTTDAFALIGGRLFGRHRLAPAVSDSKTVEGALSGIGMGFAMALVIGLSGGLPWMHVLAAGVIIPCATLIGDLLESRLKRRFGVKDAGGLLPGHGGFLDRIDGLLIAAPVLFLMIQAFCAACS